MRTMLSLLRKFQQRFRDDRSGAIAVETSIILPIILIPLALATVDVGIAINGGQSLTSATRSGTQYLLNGGESEADLTSAIASSYNGTLSANNITIATNCACPNDNALQIPEDDGSGEAPPIEQPYTLRSVTLATMDQCTATCADASNERVLVKLSVNDTSNGLYKDYPLNKEVSVRVR